MKLQDVLLKAMAKKISWMSAAEIAGITDRTMRRIRERYEKFGYTGLFDQRKGKRSIHRIPLETAEEVLRLYKELLRSEYPSLPREAAGRTQDCSELHVGTAGPAGSRTGGEAAQTGNTPAATGAETNAGHAAAH